MSNFSLEWQNPVRLAPCPTLTYKVNLEKIPEDAGVYIFFRSHGQSQVPIYVGKAENLRNRIKSHFKTSVKLMNGIKAAPHGSRQVVVGVFVPKSGQRLRTSLNRIERALIRHFDERFEILNTQGKHVKLEKLTSERPQKLNKLVPRAITFEQI